MTIKTPVIRAWQEAVLPLEQDIEERLRAEGLDSYRWSNDPGDVYTAHTHPYHKVLYVVRGSITFAFPAAGRQVTLHPGDRLDLPPNTAHEAEVGPGGVVCLEAHHA